MKVKILGDNLTSDNFKMVIDQLNQDYAPLGVKVKNATCYIRFVDENEDTVELTDKGVAIERSFKFVKEKKKVDVKNIKELKRKN